MAPICPVSKMADIRNSCGVAKTATQAVTCSPLISLSRRTITCPKAQAMAPPITSPTDGRLAPNLPCHVIRMMPQKAMPMPNHLRRPGFSPSSSAPSMTRNGTSSCTMIAAIPASSPSRPVKVRLYWIAAPTMAIRNRLKKLPLGSGVKATRISAVSKKRKAINKIGGKSLIAPLVNTSPIAQASGTVTAISTSSGVSRPKACLLSCPRRRRS